MAEFVEKNLEKLIPLFELLQNVGLYSKGEVKKFVKHCRNHEYRLQKVCKNPKDFLVYADYLQDALTLIRVRRRKLHYTHKNKEIEGAIKKKIADVYKAVTLRFQGHKDLWRKRLNFLKEENMRHSCSATYFRALQVHGNDVKFREEAAFWEFSENKSIDNARLHLQLALRYAPEAVSLWLSFFKIEIMNVERLLERRKILVGEKKSFVEEEAETSSSDDGNNKAAVGTDASLLNGFDPVLQFKLPEVIAEQALQTPELTDKKGLLLNFWRCSYQFKEVAKKLEQLIYDKLWLPENLCEESWMAKFERVPDQDPYDILDKACCQFKTEKMLRYYIQVCEKRILVDDIYASIKLKELLLTLHEAGFAQIDDYQKLLSYGEDHNEKLKILEKSLERLPSSSLLWAELINLNIKNEAKNTEMENLFNEAVKKVNPEEVLIIYQLAIDWAVAKAPSLVDRVFKNAMLASCRDVSAEVKCIRLRFCKAAFPDDPSVYRDEYKNICLNPPNSVNFHKTFIALESELARPDHLLIVAAFERCVADFGCTDYECWIDYAEYLMRNDPTEISKVYQRALACIPKKDFDSFVKEWALMTQKSCDLNSTKTMVADRS